MQKSTASDVRLDNRDRMKSGHVPLQSQSVVTAAPENAFGFDDDLTVFEPPRAVEPRPETHERKSLLAEKRQKLKQFLKNPKGTAKPAKAKATKKVISPAENVTKQDELFGEPSKAQKDIRSAFESHKSNEPTAEVPNLFGDTATEKVNSDQIQLQNICLLIDIEFLFFRYKIVARATREKQNKSNGNWLLI